MLITSRGTGRWIIPKGWPMERLAPHEAAPRRRWRRAGWSGRSARSRSAFYRYEKQADSADRAAMRGDGVCARSGRQLLQWPEQHQRRTRWFALHEAAEAVQEPELADMIRNLAALISATTARERLVLPPANKNPAISGGVEFVREERTTTLEFSLRLRWARAARSRGPRPSR